MAEIDTAQVMEHAASVDSAQSPMSLRSAHRIVIRYRRLASVTFLAAMIMVVLVTLLMPKRYESEMNIVVQNGRGNVVVTPERTIASQVSTPVTEEQVNTELEILRSTDVARAAVEASAGGSVRSADAERQLERDVEKLRQRLSVDAIRKSNIIHVAYRDRQPEVARDRLEHVLTAFLAKERSISRPSGAFAFFSKQAEQYRTELENVQQQLAAFQQKTGVVSLPDQEDMLEKQLMAEETASRENVLRIAEAREKLRSIDTQLETISPRLQTIERSIPYQLSIEQLTTLLAELKNKRESLLTRFLPSDSLVVENQKQIDQSESLLAKLREANSLEKSTDVNPLWQQLTSTSALTRAELTSLLGKEATMRSQVDSARQQLSLVESETVQYSSLKQRLTQLESEYPLYTQKRDEAQIGDAMDASKLLNVAVAEAPTLSLHPVSPKPLNNILLGAVTALFLTGIVVFLAEVNRETFATAQELEAVYTLPVICELLPSNSSSSATQSLDPQETQSYAS